MSRDIPIQMTRAYKWGTIYPGESGGVRNLTAIVCGGPCTEMSPEGLNVSWVTLDGSEDSPPCVTDETAMLARIALADLGVEMIEPDLGRIVAEYR